MVHTKDYRDFKLNERYPRWDAAITSTTESYPNNKGRTMFPGDFLRKIFSTEQNRDSIGSKGKGQTLLCLHGQASKQRSTIFPGQGERRLLLPLMLESLTE